MSSSAPIAAAMFFAVGEAHLASGGLKFEASGLKPVRTQESLRFHSLSAFSF
jgi:hypothetical protein